MEAWESMQRHGRGNCPKIKRFAPAMFSRRYLLRSDNVSLNRKKYSSRGYRNASKRALNHTSTWFIHKWKKNFNGAFIRRASSGSFKLTKNLRPSCLIDYRHGLSIRISCHLSSSERADCFFLFLLIKSTEIFRQKCRKIEIWKWLFHFTVTVSNVFSF
jgi:hypothetical protein